MAKTAYTSRRAIDPDLEAGVSPNIMQFVVIDSNGRRIPPSSRSASVPFNIGDDEVHPVSDFIGPTSAWATLADCQADYPHVETSADGLPWAAWKAAVDSGATSLNGIGRGTYRLNKMLKVPNSNLRLYNATFRIDRSPMTFTANATTNVLTTAAPHVFVAGQMVWVEGEDVAAPLAGTSPTPVAGYYVINPTATTLQLSLTEGGAAIDLTDAGTGTQYLRPWVYESFGVQFNGDVSQANCAVEDCHFIGAGKWGGIISTGLYLNESLVDSEGVSVPYLSPGVPDELNYTTTRKGFKFSRLTFAGPAFEGIFLTNVQTDLDDIAVSDCLSLRTVYSIYVRGTRQIAVNNIKIHNTPLAIGISHTDGLALSNVQITADFYDPDALQLRTGPYIGHFMKNVVMSNCHTTLEGGGYTKFSAYASNIVVSSCSWKGGGGIIIQGVSGLTIDNCVIETTQWRAVWCNYQPLGGDIDNYEVTIRNTTIKCTNAGEPTAGWRYTIDAGLDEPRNVQLSNCVASRMYGCTVDGNVYARPGRDLMLRGNDFTWVNPGGFNLPGVFIRDFDGLRIYRNTFVRLDTANTTVYLVGNEDGLPHSNDLSFIDNEFSQNAPSHIAVVVSSCDTGKFHYKGNVGIGSKPNGELSYSYEAADEVQVLMTDLFYGLRSLVHDGRDQLQLYTDEHDADEAGGALRTYPHHSGKFGFRLNAYYAREGFPYTRCGDIFVDADYVATMMRFLTRGYGLDAVCAMLIDDTQRVILPLLTASLPVKTGADKQLVAAAIDLESEEVTGVLPPARGGTGAGALDVSLPVRTDGTGALTTGPTDLASDDDVTGILGVAHGGTGETTLADAAAELLGAVTWSTFASAIKSALALGVGDISGLTGALDAKTDVAEYVAHVHSGVTEGSDESGPPA